MSQKEITEIKLSCLQQAKYQCQLCPEKALKIAKELFDWVMKLE